MIARLKSDPFSVAMIRVLALLLIVTTIGLVAAALGAPGIEMSTTAGVLVGGTGAVAAVLGIRNAQLKRQETDGHSPQ